MRSSTARQAPPQFSTCRQCRGQIAYYPRTDVAPNTTEVNDQSRWAHLQVGDWLSNPHRAQPTATVCSQPDRSQP